MDIITRPIDIVDTHTHILPSIDDGSSSVTESVSLIKTLIHQGVDTIVLTPHYYFSEISTDSFLENRKLAFSQLLDEPEIHNINLILGAEVYFSIYLHSIERLSELCIGGTKYLLLELPFMKKIDSRTISYIEKIIYNNNLIPVIAHAERYLSIGKKNIEAIQLLDEMGCMIQLNAESFLIKPLQKHCLKIIETGAVVALGSDSHNMKDRKPEMNRAIQFLSDTYGNDVTRGVINNAKLILSGKDAFLNA
ncbi:MAG: hypothetical protein BGN88_11985 [Clostridiales bacterium 43-6]|nr:MAG: hypothetical protein BGN88_11985 [Clostridiales bacterium 43-6]